MAVADITDSNIMITTTNTTTTMTNITIITVEMTATEDMEDTMTIRIKITKPMIADHELEVNIIRIRIISIITSRIITQEKVDIKITITLETKDFKIRRIKTLMKTTKLIILNKEMNTSNSGMKLMKFNNHKL